MRYSIRIQEDWLALGLSGLLIYVLVRALAVEMWWLCALSVIFLAGTLAVLRKMMRARWCKDCQLPMIRAAVPPGQQSRLYYRCDRCGRVINSGIELNRPE